MTKTTPPPVERASSIKFSMVLALIAYAAILGSLIYYVLVPKQVMLKTNPAGGTVYVNGILRCPKTPCNIGLNRIFPKTIMIDLPHYFPYTIELPAFGIGWNHVLISPIQLTSVINQQELATALESCRQDRKGLTDTSQLEAQPCYRVPPVMPLRAFRSGHCHVVFDVNEKGKPVNIRLNGCTDAVFASPAEKSVSLWEYLPAIKDNKAVPHEDIETQITFRLTDETGQIIPEPDIFAADSDHTHNIAVHPSLEAEKE